MAETNLSCNEHELGSSDTHPAAAHRIFYMFALGPTHGVGIPLTRDQGVSALPRSASWQSLKQVP